MSLILFDFWCLVIRECLTQTFSIPAGLYFISFVLYFISFVLIDLKMSIMGHVFTVK